MSDLIDRLQKNEHGIPRNSLCIEAAERIAELESALTTALSALNAGFHSGFCSNKCQICDNYKAAMEIAKSALGGKP